MVQGLLWTGTLLKSWLILTFVLVYDVFVRR